MKKIIIVLSGLFSLLACNEQEYITDDDRIAGTYVVINDGNMLGTIYKVIHIGYGTLAVEQGKDPILYQNGYLYGNFYNDDNLTQIICDYSYENRLFKSDYFSGPLIQDDYGRLILKGETILKVLDTSVTNPDKSWWVAIRPRNSTGWTNVFKMNWLYDYKRDGINGWWHGQFTASENYYLTLWYNYSTITKDYDMDRGPAPSQDLYLNEPFSAIEGGNYITVGSGTWDIYLSTDATKMVITQPGYDGYTK